MPIKVLVVDDSAFMRKVISDKINQIEGCEVQSIARSGEVALQMIAKKKPDIVTLDIEMPGLNGLETLEKIKENFDIPVIMLSSHSGEEMTIASLELGATDFIEKPEKLLEIGESFKEELEQKIKTIARRGKTTKVKSAEKKISYGDLEKEIPNRLRAIVIGASTGGPRALMQLIKKIPKDLAIPIIIVQHMPSGFTTSFSKRLNQEAAVEVVEAKQGMLIKGGTVYVAPGDYHLRIKGSRIHLSLEEAKIHGVRPAVDYLFSSTSHEYKNNLLAIILTGMGNDGTNGLKEVRKNKGYVIAQDQQSSVVFGMPRRAIEAGVVDSILSLDELCHLLPKIIGEKQWK